MRRTVFALTIAAGLFGGCEALCGCLVPPPMEIVYGRVESAAGTGIPTSVVLYRLALDTVCVADDLAQAGEIDVGTEGRFRAEISGDFRAQPQCLELRAFDPAVGKADTASMRVFVDFDNPDSTRVVLRLP